MRVGYGKLGRTLELSDDKWGVAGGDNEPAALLLRLAEKHPSVTWVVVGRNSGWEPPLPNIENPWQDWLPQIKASSKSMKTDPVAVYDSLTFETYESLDEIVMWIGQHCPANSPIPRVDDRSTLVTPYESAIAYGSHVCRGINRWQDRSGRQDRSGKEPVWLIADPRNYLKARDLKWPRTKPILGQFDFVRNEKCEHGDRVLPSRDQYVYSGLELSGIRPPTPLSVQRDWSERDRFGAIINECRNYGIPTHLTRLDALKRYILPLKPSWIHGSWTDNSLADAGVDIKPIEYQLVDSKMQSTLCTLTTPASGSGWATAKPWECFANHVVCFFHPYYDTQGHIIPTLNQLDDPSIPGDSKTLAKWLRVSGPDELKLRVDAVSRSRQVYKTLVELQYELLTSALKDLKHVRMIEERIGL